MKHVPVLVEATMASPLVVTVPVPLEGILYDERFRRTSRMGDPLEYVAYRDGYPVASAGAMVCDGIAGPGFAEVRLSKSIKRSDRAEEILLHGADANSKISEMSPYRPQIDRRTAIEGVSTVAFLAMADVDALNSALARTPSIGGLRMRSYGEVAEWSVRETECENERDFGWYGGGMLLRRLPRRLAEERFGQVPEGAYVDFCRPEPPFTDEDGRDEVAAPLLNSMIMTRHKAMDVGFL